MKQSKLFAPTLREMPSDAEAKSHQLMLRAGYIRQVASGVYAYLPLAHRVLANITQIVREEMEAIDAVEMDLPSFIPADLWQETGRYATYGPELMKIKDRHERDFILGPTHEETFTDLIRGDIDSYKKLPLTLYQIQTKYRDEKRPRFGLLRGREFLMKDAYSFHMSDETLDETYQAMNQAYSKIFSRLGLNYKAIIGDAGSMGGRESTEFMALSESGEDTIVYSNASDYAANLEMAESAVLEISNDQPQLEREIVETPNVRTIEEVGAFLSKTSAEILKSVLFIVDDEQPVFVVVRGDHTVNEVKVKGQVGASSLRPATDEEIIEQFGATPGFAGPIDLPENVQIIVDYHVKNSINTVIGANKEGYHFININPDRDFDQFEYADLRTVEEGDPAPTDEGQLVFERGIEIGHIFKLGTFYSEKMNATVLDNTGRPQPIIMGSYGIGISRLLSAIIEQNYDDKGIVWPSNIAPFDVHIVPIKLTDADQSALTEEIKQLLEEAGLSVLIDDRNERAGVKFTDAELFGIPVQITVGRDAADGIVELTSRRDGQQFNLKKEDIIDTIKQLDQ
ncbi:proline--tRNA ligase [Dolosigranulum pigrum]|jgi:proline--tRNA ligase|uniref:Proline--tRNA ligase n=1 Tax=Dolosigranulum pigrum TaxID=29394 RepID=A0A328KHG6_9LACT|nr:proline--tRNA ligase [Dolosigranulum pigrum]QTJ43163.1 proline--tRNA ligase [Dolosigranulum pigrum]QTJ46579.1 proline--tRNA ligase [Dolosigranulum pigrum]QTJ53321.1 proline--tRNA ligase [Dolosigranulum pigrum]QTJ60101.1 proline--tRNA ligase [Dolosigranulum pigrum]RAN52008.1 proline--tRNA ligase [Dolosigranulum pigrum]